MRFHILDTETIGLNPPEQGSGVCEVSVREVNEDLNLIEHYYAKLYPEAPISAAATAVHGIFDAHVANAPTMAEWLESGAGPDWREGTEPIYFIAYNAMFDYKFLAQYIGCEVKIVDALRLCRRYYPDAENHKMQTLRVILELPFDIEDQHSAGGDTKTLKLIMKRLSEDTGLSLMELCEDAQRKDPILKMPFGKFKNKLITDIAQDNPDYFEWCLKNIANMDPDLKKEILEAMEAAHV